MFCRRSQLLHGLTGWREVTEYRQTRAAKQAVSWRFRRHTMLWKAFKSWQQQVWCHLPACQQYVLQAYPDVSPPLCPLPSSPWPPLPGPRPFLAQCPAPHPNPANPSPLLLPNPVSLTPPLLYLPFALPLSFPLPNTNCLMFTQTPHPPNHKPHSTHLRTGPLTPSPK